MRMKNAVESICSRTNQMEETINESEDRNFEIMQKRGKNRS